MYYQVSKKLALDSFNGDPLKAHAAGYSVAWSREKIRRAFQFGNGTNADFKAYMAANSCSSFFFKS